MFIWISAVRTGLITVCDYPILGDVIAEQQNIPCPEEHVLAIVMGGQGYYMKWLIHFISVTVFWSRSASTG